jgi:hypothetical protein
LLARAREAPRRSVASILAAVALVAIIGAAAVYAVVTNGATANVELG